MTTRLNGLVVTFKEEIREDDAEAIVNAIRMIKGVLSVDPVPADLDTHMAKEQVRSELAAKLWEVLKK